MRTKTRLATLLAAAMGCIGFGGSASAQLPTVAASSLDGTNGFAIVGVDAEDYSGYAVKGVGDINGDGLDDILVTTGQIDPGGTPNIGEAYVVYGASSGLPAAFDLSTLDGSNGFRIAGLDVPDFGSPSRTSAGGAFDLNGDGIEDLVIGKPFASPGGRSFAGKAYVVFGSSTGFAATLDLSTLDGTNGLAIHGVSMDDTAGFSVGGADDVNGDGIDDLVIGAASARIGANQTGETYVVFGSTTGFPPTLELSSLDGTNGFAMNGANQRDKSGWSVDAEGDVNGDGLADIVIGAPGNRVGKAWILFGSTSAFPASVDLTALDGTDGLLLSGADEEAFGTSVAIIGDVNLDGFDDVAIGAPNANVDFTGRTYVLYGSDAGFSASIDATSLDGTNGFSLDGSALEAAGFSVDGAGDVNGDGIADLLIGAVNGAPGGRGYVVYGSATGFPATTDLADLDSLAGYALTGTNAGDSAGASISAAGDVNGDGTGDFVVGAPSTSPGGTSLAGESYVVFGANAGCLAGSVDRLNGPPSDVLFIQGSNGGVDRTVGLSDDTTEFALVTIIEPPAGGNGKFVLHANTGRPSILTETSMPFDVGNACFPFLLGSGASPVIIANNVGKTGLVGESQYFGTPADDPASATTTLLYPMLPIGTVLTFQAIAIDPGSVSPKSASMTNAVILEVLP